ncbi:TRAP transporter substrate-binding protein DctP [Tropicimonas sp. IMCC34043]|uniref:TRAP transporter substrate-binding protein DctP n=1 Tax=Tropicimonas sp. IMCC34043 TaxID=2248760 RepID=UPI001300174B|nr:TRAP transporter substrate-binding protein DctP [Tropicimonas sp. IMCC34043]
MLKNTAFTAFAATLATAGAVSAQDAGAACSAALEAPVSFRISHQNSPTSPIHPHLEKIVADVTAATDGKLDLAVFPSAQLGGEMQALEQAAFGENVIFYITAGALATAGVPELSILNGPFLTPTLESAQKLEKSSLIGGFKDRLAEKAGLHVLALNWFDAPRSILGHQGYPEPSDLVGVKMRVPEAPAYLRTFETLKTAPQAIPFSELYLALQQGVVDAAEGGIDGMANANLMEVAKTVTVTDHFRVFYGFAMSEELYAKLPEPCQTLLSDEFSEKGDAYSAGMDEITINRIAELKTEGVIFVEADKDAYRVATEPFYSLFPEWPDGLLADVRAAMQ